MYLGLDNIWLKYAVYRLFSFDALQFKLPDSQYFSYYCKLCQRHCIPYTGFYLYIKNNYIQLKIYFIYNKSDITCKYNRHYLPV